jgi:ubiquinone/menaquinone biosynthesis C-methylase UbiE
MKEKDTKIILSELEAGYDLIAEKFSGTRAFVWRDLNFLKDYVKLGDKILDFGCGNGRLAGFLEGNYLEYIGVDISHKLVDLARQRYHSEKTEFIKINSDSRKLPFKKNHFHIVFSIAVFHHFPSKEYVLKVAKELHRVLKPGGKIIVTAWNLWQKKYLKYHQRSNNDWTSARIPFKSGENTFDRYHHPFQIGELEELFAEVGFKTIKTKKGWNLLYIGGK